MQRVKTMLVIEFDEVFKRNWKPVRLVEDAVPPFVRRIPEHIRHSFIASGQYCSTTPYHSSLIKSARLVGGIDVYRRSPDDSVELNKDWYAVVTSPSDYAILMVEGPIRDEEHWLDQIPERYDHLETVGSPIKVRLL